MRVINYLKENDGLHLNTDNGMIKLQIVADKIIRVIYTRAESFSTKPSMMVESNSRGISDWTSSDEGDVLKIKTPGLQLVVNKETTAFSWYDNNGYLLVKEPDRGGKTLTEIDVVKSSIDEDTEVVTIKTVDGERSILKNATTYIDRKGYHTKLEFLWVNDEAIYGLGQHEEGIFNYRGHEQYLFQTNMKISIPVILSTRGYGIFVDSCSFMTFHDDQYGSYLWTEVDDEMDYYFIYGPEFDNIIHGLRILTGKASMLPRWAFGYVQSKEHYKSQDELLTIAKEYRDREIPMDCIVQDWKSWTGDLWGQKTFDPGRYPDPVRMMDELHGMGVKLMISVWPNMRNGSANQQEMKEEGCLLGDGTTYDAFSEKARELYWKQTNEGLFSKGVDAWWCDSTEPFSGPDWKGETRMEPWERMATMGGEFKKYIDPEYVNAYSLMHSKGIYDGQRNTDDSKRVVNLIRSAYPGQQKFGTIPWSGDISATWRILKQQIAQGLNFCMTGFPYWTLDIGAFFTGGINSWRKWCGNDKAPRVWFWHGDYDTGCEDMGYRELYTRFFQYGTFLPMFRSHGTDTPREVWRFGESGTMFYDVLVKFIKLRYRLMPYIYSLAGRVNFEDYTMMRALTFDFRNDKKTHDIDDQYMFGPAILVNPVTRPMYYESCSRKLEGVEKNRQVYLPQGTGWYDFWTGEWFAGGRRMDADAPIEILPLYIRAGSIIPLGPEVQHTGEKLDTPYELRIYTGEDGVFTLYEDEGDNYNYENGACTMTQIKWDDGNRQLVIEERAGSFNGMVRNRILNIALISKDSRIGAEALTNSDKVIEYNGKKVVVEFK